MKTPRSLVICAFLFAAPLALGRDIGPIGVGSADKSDMANAKEAGLKLGKPYSVNRDILLRASWRPDTKGMDSQPLFKDSPEISCGTGYDAICQAVFLKNGQSLVLTVDQNMKSLPLAHVNKE